MRSSLLGLLLLTSLPAMAQSDGAARRDCGEVVAIATHDGTTTRYALARPSATAAQGEPVVLVLLVGGGGYMDLDAKGCARYLKGNSLLRQIRHFHEAGLMTAVVDAPSDHSGKDGLAGFRIAPEHAQDLGQVIADIRARTQAAVWVAGTSRGTISAVNAASRLSGPSAPDGIILTSAVTSGARAKKAWVAHTVYNLPLESIRAPLLVVGHVADGCLRSPASRMEDIVSRTNGVREQVVTVSGGPGVPAPGVDVCEGLTPHGFTGQEREVAAGIARFIRGARY